MDRSLDSTAVTDAGDEVRRRYGRGNLWLAGTAGPLLIIGFWGYWASLKWGTGEQEGAPRDPFMAQVFLIVALAGTALGLPILYLYIRGVRALASRGVLTAGRVEKISMFGKHGKSPTTVVYVVDGREYRIRRDLIRRRVEVGGTVRILYDPQKPKRCDVLQ